MPEAPADSFWWWWWEGLKLDSVHRKQSIPAAQLLTKTSLPEPEIQKEAQNSTPSGVASALRWWESVSLLLPVFSAGSWTPLLQVAPCLHSQLSKELHPRPTWERPAQPRAKNTTTSIWQQWLDAVWVRPEGHLLHVGRAMGLKPKNRPKSASVFHYIFSSCQAERLWTWVSALTLSCAGGALVCAPNAGETDTHRSSQWLPNLVQHRTWHRSLVLWVLVHMFIISVMVSVSGCTSHPMGLPVWKENWGESGVFARSVLHWDMKFSCALGSLGQLTALPFPGLCLALGAAVCQGWVTSGPAPTCSLLWAWLAFPYN